MGGFSEGYIERITKAIQRRGETFRYRRNSWGRLLSRKEVAQTDYLVEYQGKPMKKFRNSFKTAYQKAGITYACRMYDVRRLFASVMLAGGADLAAVSKLMGHSITQQTANTYYELLKGEKRKAVQILPVIIEEEERQDKVFPFRSVK